MDWWDFPGRAGTLLTCRQHRSHEASWTGRYSIALGSGLYLDWHWKVLQRSFAISPCCPDCCGVGRELCRRVLAAQHGAGAHKRAWMGLVAMPPGWDGMGWAWRGREFPGCSFVVLLSGQKKSRVTPHLLARHGGTEMWVTLDTITTVLIFEYERKFFSSVLNSNWHYNWLA